MADSTVPVTVVLCTLSQEPICLAKAYRFLAIPSILASLTSSQVFLMSFLSSLTA